MASEKESSVEYQIRFDYLPASPLENGWQKVSTTDFTPQFHSASGIPGGLFMQTGGHVFAMDYHIPWTAQKSYLISFTGEFRRGAILYAEIDVLTKGGSSQAENWWFAHVLGSKDFLPVKDPNNREWIFQVEPTDDHGSQFVINLIEEVNRVLANENKSFLTLKSIRLRGDILLSPIQLRSKEASKVQLPARKPWLSVTTIISLVVLLVAILTLVGMFVVPEVRRYFRIEKSASEPSSASVGTTGGIPKQNLLVAETAATIQDMRRDHNVNLIAQVESEKTVDEIPPNSYSFAYVSGFTHELPLTITSKGSVTLVEIHKLHDGSVSVIGYVGPETLIRLREGIAPSETFTFYSGSLKEAANIIAIPQSRFRCNRTRDVDKVVALDCNVKD
jgi:hypothetical protein